MLAYLRYPKLLTATAGIIDSHVRGVVCVFVPLEEGSTLLGTMSTLAFHYTIIRTKYRANYGGIDQHMMRCTKPAWSSMTHVFWQEQSRPKVARSVSPPSSSPLAAVIGVKTVDDGTVKNGASDEELDELDAQEAAQFKADVQGHRHHEVNFIFLVRPEALFSPPHVLHYRCKNGYFFR